MATKHGMYGTPTYKSWSEMKHRCGNKKLKYWQNITYCERWEKFSNFFEDMGVRPKGTTLDRINVLGNYDPSNCRWATYKKQSNNKTNNVKYNIEGEELTLSEIARKYGISRSNLANKIYCYHKDIYSSIDYLVNKKKSKERK